MAAVLLAVGNSGEQSYQLACGALRLLYFSIVTAYFVTNFPRFRVKTPLEFCSIGDSSARAKYYKSAISELSPRAKLSIVSKSESGDLTEDGLARHFSKNNQVYLISTPTPYHFKYVLELARLEKRFFCEKPLVQNRSELRLLRSHFANLFAQGFLMQYYILDKSLALTYLFYPFREYELALAGPRSESVLAERRPELAWKLKQLGRIERIAVHVREGGGRDPSGDTLAWTEQRKYGGAFWDLGIHAFSLVRLIVGPNARFIVNELAARHSAARLSKISHVEQQEMAPSSFEIKAKATLAEGAEVGIEISFGKFFPEQEQKRDCVIHFEHGRIVHNIDDKSVNLILKGSDVGLTVRNECRELNYWTILVLGLAQLDGELPYRLDVPEVQMAAIDDMLGVEEMFQAVLAPPQKERSVESVEGA